MPPSISTSQKVQMLEESDRVKPTATIYCGGFVPYKEAFLEHARQAIYWDVLRRWLELLGYQVDQIQNFIDIDDRIFGRALLEKATEREISDRYIDDYLRCLSRFNILDAYLYQRSTDCIDRIIEFIGTLLQKKIASNSRGSVYLRSSSACKRFSGLPRDYDNFQLWDPRRAKNETRRTKQELWQSPWGLGRPTLFAQKSAISPSPSYEQSSIIDVSDGEIRIPDPADGQDLTIRWLHMLNFVHTKAHETEDSHQEEVSITPFLDGSWSAEKDRIDPMALKLFLLKFHYRSTPILNKFGIRSAQLEWNMIRKSQSLNWDSVEFHFNGRCDRSNHRMKLFLERLNDDLDTPWAIALLLDLAKDLLAEFDLRRTIGAATRDDELQEQIGSGKLMIQTLGLQEGNI